MTNPYYQAPKITLGLKPNAWDALALIIILGILAALAHAASTMDTPYPIGVPLKISLEVTALPGYAAHTVLRMFIALFFSFLFTLIVAPLAAKNKPAEKILLPLIDILQSVPILGVLAITVTSFIQLFPNSRLGPECAAIFAIFTSQVWNMTLSFYQSIRTTPKEFYETAAVFHLSAWQQFWRIEVPYAIPGLLWNTMISLSAGWFFVVACEAISVANQSILLPGIGSYISVAISEANLPAITYSIISMLVVILLYDQLLFRPLLTWARRFNLSLHESTHHRPWFYELLIKTQALKYCSQFLSNFFGFFLYAPYPFKIKKNFTAKSNTAINSRLSALWNLLLLFVVMTAILFLWKFITESISVGEIQHVFYLGAITTLKVVLLILFASLIWVPIGVWVGLHPKIGHWIQPMTQFFAAFPVNLVYPIAVTFIIRFKLNVEIWTAPLMILGTQWYILFNVIAGALAIPQELHLVTKNLRIKGWLWWKRLALPALFPYYITGSMTAAAGCWNASIVADVLEWGDHRLIASGLGSYISEYTTVGDFPRILLGIGVMCLYVLGINHFIWRKLYDLSASRFTLE